MLTPAQLPPRLRYEGPTGPRHDGQSQSFRFDWPELLHRYAWEGSLLQRLGGWTRIANATEAPMRALFADDNPWRERWRDAGAMLPRGGRRRDWIVAWLFAFFALLSLLIIPLLLSLNPRVLLGGGFGLGFVAELAAVASAPCAMLLASTAYAGWQARSRLESDPLVDEFLATPLAKEGAPMALRWLAAVQARWYAGVAGRVVAILTALFWMPMLAFFRWPAFVYGVFATLLACWFARQWTAGAWARISRVALAPTLGEAWRRAVGDAILCAVGLPLRFAAYGTLAGFLPLGLDAGELALIFLAALGEWLLARSSLARAEVVWRAEGPALAEAIRVRKMERDVDA